MAAAKQLKHHRDAQLAATSRLFVKCCVKSYQVSSARIAVEWRILVTTF
jgi:hypothetical protein